MSEQPDSPPDPGADAGAEPAPDPGAHAAPVDVPDEALPEDLRPGEDNPLAEGLEPGERAGDLLEEGKHAEQSEGAGSDTDGTASDSSQS